MPKQANKTEEHYQDILDRLKAFECDLDDFTSFARVLNVPAEMVPAVMAGRPELMSLAKPRPLTQEDCRILYEMVGNLLETNAQLRRHAHLISSVVEDWILHFRGLAAVSRRIQEFASFQPLAECEDENE